MKPDLKTILGALILAGFAVAVEIWFGWARVLAPWRDVPVATIVTALALTFATYLLRAWRVYDYFHADLRGRFAACVKLTLQHNLFNNFLPMRAGEISFPVLMARYFNVRADVSVPVLFWFRVMDLHALVAIALLAVGDAWLGHAWTVPVTAVWLVLPLLAFQVHVAWLRRLGTAPRGAKRVLAKILSSFPQTARAFWRATLWTWINWITKLGVFAWVLALFIPVPWSGAWLAAILGDLTSVLPIHGIAGAGTYEAGVVAALLPFGVTGEHALAAAVNLHLFVLGSTVVGGVVAGVLPGGGRV